MVRGKMKKLDCICFGSIIADYRSRSASRRKETMPLRLLDEKSGRFQIGGIPILAVVMGRMGFKVGLAGMVGRDIIGYGIKRYIDAECGIDTGGIQAINGATSYSLITLTRRERFIRHYAGANAFLTANKNVITYIENKRPVLTAIGYSGLLPRMDDNHGEKMAEFIKTLDGMGILAALDTHTMKNDYAMLDKPLKRADVFFCNEREAENISCRKGTEEMADNLARLHFSAADKYRFLGITLPSGVYLIYGRGNNRQGGFVKSRWYTANPVDLTGAGDAFRAGIYGYIIKNKKAFDTGVFDWRKAGMLGNFTAGVMVTEGMAGIGNYTAMCGRIF